MSRHPEIQKISAKTPAEHHIKARTQENSTAWLDFCLRSLPIVKGNPGENLISLQFCRSSRTLAVRLDFLAGKPKNPFGQTN